MGSLLGEPGRSLLYWEHLKVHKTCQGRAFEMEHLSHNRGFVRGTWREGLYAEDCERHVMEGSENRAFLYTRQQIILVLIQN